jgi:Na+/proline symporter
MDFGLMWAYICFNIAAAVSLYYLFRVRTWKTAQTRTSLSLLKFRLESFGALIRSMVALHEKCPRGKEAEHHQVF